MSSLPAMASIFRLLCGLLIALGDFRQSGQLFSGHRCLHVRPPCRGPAAFFARVPRERDTKGPIPPAVPAFVLHQSPP